MRVCTTDISTMVDFSGGEALAVLDVGTLRRKNGRKPRTPSPTTRGVRHRQGLIESGQFQRRAGGGIGELLDGCPFEA